MQRAHSTPFSTLLWVAYLVLALVFVQGARLHMHMYSHDSAMSDHGAQVHQGAIHFEFYNPETPYPDEAGQIDLSQQAMAKKMSLDSMTVALFVALLILLPLRLALRLPWRRYRRLLPASRLSSLRPPLRAPPR